MTPGARQGHTRLVLCQHGIGGYRVAWVRRRRTRVGRLHGSRSTGTHATRRGDSNLTAHYLAPRVVGSAEAETMAPVGRMYMATRRLVARFSSVSLPRTGRYLL